MKYIPWASGSRSGRHYIKALDLLANATPGGAAAFTDELVSASRALRVTPPDAAAISALQAAYDDLAAG